MIRKSSTIVVATGCALLAAALVLVSYGLRSSIVGQEPLTYPATSPRWWDLVANLAAVGAACLWWPLASRPRIRTPLWFQALGWALDGALLLIVAPLLFGAIEMGIHGLGRDDPDAGRSCAYELFLLYGLIAVIHLAAIVRFLWRPRLLFTWALGILLAPFFCTLVYMLTIPLNSWGSEAGLLWIALVVWGSPFVAPLLGLPFAWWWVKAAEKRATIRAGAAAPQRATP